MKNLLILLSLVPTLLTGQIYQQSDTVYYNNLSDIGIFRGGVVYQEDWRTYSLVFKKYANSATQKLLHSVGDNKIIIEGTTVKYSSDNGVTYNSGVNLSGIFTLSKARILENGKVLLFSTDTSFYYSDDSLTTVTACSVLDSAGNQYNYHTPANASYPGGYWYFMGGYVENNGLIVVGNYTNSSYGASPVNLYYSLDGVTWKVFYTFGANPNYTDNGTALGGVGGTILGDTNNTLITRHIHSINLGYDDKIYVCTGDGANEMHILCCDYDRADDSWTVQDLLNATTDSYQRFRALGAYERNGYLYWGADGSTPITIGETEYQSKGIWRSKLSEINDITKHTLLYDSPDVFYSFYNVGRFVFGGLQTTQDIIFSTNYGDTWRAFDKPVYMTGEVQGVWYNQDYQYYGSHFKNIIEIKRGLYPNGNPYSLTGAFQDTAVYLSCSEDITNEDGFIWERSLDSISWYVFDTTATSLCYDYGFTFGQDNYYRVKAYKDGYNNSEYSNDVAVKVYYGPELLGSWTLVTGWTLASGILTYDAINNAVHVYQNVVGDFTLNSYYIVQFTISNCATNAGVYINLQGSPCFDLLNGTQTLQNGTYFYRTKCINSTGTYLRLGGVNTEGFSGFSISNISIKAANP